MIPIFEGKQAIYNKTILEALLIEGPMTTWQLAKKITPKIKTVKRTLSSTETQKVYSVLIRKDGRLNDLKFKEYVIFDEENQKWEVAAKGLFAICIEKPQLKPLINLKYWNTRIIGDFKFSKEKIEVPFAGITINGKKFEKCISFLLDKMKAKSTFFIEKTIEYVKKLIDEGINLDKISTKSLLHLLWIKGIQKHDKEISNIFPDLFMD
jgi:hypothetical protein